MNSPTLVFFSQHPVLWLIFCFFAGSGLGFWVGKLFR